MSKLLEAMKEETNIHYTNNGQEVYKSSTNDFVDLLPHITSFRNNLFKNKYFYNPMLELGKLHNVSHKDLVEEFNNHYLYINNKSFFNLLDKILLTNPSGVELLKLITWARDIEQGLGERAFYELTLFYIFYISEPGRNLNPSIIKTLIKNSLGRYTDFLPLLLIQNSPVAKMVTETFKEILDEDLISYDKYVKTGNEEELFNLSLLAKWLPSQNTSSQLTKEYSRIVIKHFNMTPKEYRKTLSKLRKALNIVETNLTNKSYENIVYSKLPSYAYKKYERAFMRNDTERFQEHIDNVSTGKEKINSSILYPYDIIKSIRDFIDNRVSSSESKMKKSIIKEQWANIQKDLKEIIPNDTLVVHDSSLSMTSRIGWTSLQYADVADSLALLLAENCNGLFHNKIITFSYNPTVVEFDEKLDSIIERYLFLKKNIINENTDIYKVFKLILKCYEESENITPDDLPKNILLISDGHFDSMLKHRVHRKLEKSLEEMFHNVGLEPPRIIFWNLDASAGIPCKANDTTFTYTTGFSPNVLKSVLSGETSEDVINNILSNPRYDFLNKI